MLTYTFVLNCSDHISPPVLQFQAGVFHSLIFWDVANMQNSTIETLLIHVSFGGSETTSISQNSFISFFPLIHHPS